MKAVIVIAGYGKHHSDSFRKAIAKKKANLIAEHREYFIDGRKEQFADSGKMVKDAIPGGVAMGHNRVDLENLYNEMEEFGKYSFNKCFSAYEKLYRIENRGSTPTIEQMYKIKNDKEYAVNRGKLSLHEKYKNKGYGKVLSMCEDGRLRPNKIIDIYYSGKRDVYLITTEHGHTVQCTLNHNFPTPKGKKMLSGLKIGDELYTKDDTEKQQYIKKNMIRYSNFPKKGQCGFQKGGPIRTWFFDEYRLSKIGQECEICKDKIGKELHHKDGNVDNNVEENYQWLCISCHKKEHYKVGRTKAYQKGIPTKISKIVNIELIGEEDVYDVEMEAPYHNVLTKGGIVASNSHAAAYAVIAYLTAWFKHNFPAEFMASLMDSVNKNKTKVGQYMNHCRKDLGIEILPPDINMGSSNFIPLHGKKIIYSLSAKGATSENLALICKEREIKPFESMFDFFKRCMMTVDKSTLEALIGIGAFDNFKVKRSEYLAAVEDITDKLSKIKAAKKRSEEPPKETKKKRTVKKKEFVFDDRFKLEDLIPQDIIEFPDDVKLRIEKEYLGLYLSGHPLYKYNYVIAKYSNFKSSDIEYEIDNETGFVALQNPEIRNYKAVQFVVVINNIRELVTKKNDLMAFVEVEDLYGICKTVIFPSCYPEIKPILKEDEVYILKGKLQIKVDEIPCIIVESLAPVSQSVTKRLIIEIDDWTLVPEILEYLWQIKTFGQNPVYLKTNNSKILLPTNMWLEIELFLQYFDRRDLIKNLQILEW